MKPIAKSANQDSAVVVFRATCATMKLTTNPEAPTIAELDELANPAPLRRAAHESRRGWLMQPSTNPRTAR